MYRKMYLLITLLLLDASSASTVPVWRDITASAAARAVDMMDRMTLQQKAMSMLQETDSIALPDGSGTVAPIYNAECLHGPKAHGYISTVFPSPIAQAASFDRSLVHKMARATSDDLRSSWNEGQDWSYCFAPDVNLVRDPRYGRGQEMWGEDPWLTSQSNFTSNQDNLRSHVSFLRLIACEFSGLQLRRRPAERLRRRDA